MFLFKTARASIIFSGVSCGEGQKLDEWEELIAITGCLGRGSNRRPLSPQASTMPLIYPAKCMRGMLNPRVPPLA